HQVKYLGAVVGDDDRILTLRQFAVAEMDEPIDHGAMVLLIVGTSAEVGKTTVGVSVLRTLLAKGHSRVIVLKATGTSAVAEIATYRDYGAAQAFDCVDFGLPRAARLSRTAGGPLSRGALPPALPHPCRCRPDRMRR